MEKYRVNDSYLPLPTGDVRLEGPIGDLADRLFEQRLCSSYARGTVYRETIDAFRDKLDDADRVVGMWRGEFWGKWVISAARAARYGRNAELAKFVRDAAYELISLRDADGCITTYRDRDFFSAAPPEEVVKVLGKKCDFNWNIWCRKYTLWGLLEAYELCGERPILDAAAVLASQLIDSLRRKNLDIHRTGTFLGMASCSILKPMLILFRHTKDARFMDFAHEIVTGWSQPDGPAPNLIVNARSGKPVHEWYPELESWAKTYEMLSCFDGILEYYRVTGRKECLEAAEKLCDLVWEHEQNRPGSVGFNDQFQHAGIYLNSVTEPCDAIHWMRLCFELFKLTGREKYMDRFEITFLNAFLAGIFRDGSWGMRSVRSSGCHQTAPEQSGMKYNHCCVDNLPRGIVNAAESCLMAGKDGVVVNHYVPFSVATVLEDGNRIAVRVSGEYLTRGTVQLSVSTEKPLVMKLRIPEWSGKLQVETDSAVREFSGSSAKLEFAPGKSDLVLRFEFRPRIVRFPYPGEPEKFPAWHKRRYFNGQNDIGLEPVSGFWALVEAGPLRLARGKLAGSGEKWKNSRLATGKWECRLAPEELPGTLAAFEAGFVSAEGEAFECHVCDFASAGNVGGCDPELFSMFF